MNEIGSWMTSVNRNVEGKDKPRVMRYSGRHPAYRPHCDAVAADGIGSLRSAKPRFGNVAEEKVSVVLAVYPR